MENPGTFIGFSTTPFHHVSIVQAIVASLPRISKSLREMDYFYRFNDLLGGVA
jgi:hypothetical protein